MCVTYKLLNHASQRDQTVHEGVNISREDYCQRSKKNSNVIYKVLVIEIAKSFKIIQKRHLANVIATDWLDLSDKN